MIGDADDVEILATMFEELLRGRPETRARPDIAEAPAKLAEACGSGSIAFLQSMFSNVRGRNI